MPDLVEILVTAKNLTGPAFGEAKAGASSMESSMTKLNKASTLAAEAVVGFVGASIAMAADFDSKMTLLVTQAGVSKDQIGFLKKGVLDLAGQVGFSPDSLAESLYHVESNAQSMGITATGALNLVKVAAEGAATGHADLVDVTNALTAAVASGIPGVQNMSQAMGVLNATVGVGDMSMQDLASAFGSGMVATVKGFGLSIADVGAALATFGDNNIRGAQAGTQLRMTVQALASPVASASDALQKLGLTHQTLADDMQKGGLKLALEDLSSRMKNAGITADQQGEIITQAFGKKAGAGLNVLMDQMDRLESKYPALQAGADNFGQAWADTQKTFSQQMKDMDAAVQALMISIGEKLIPYVQRAVTFFQQHKQVTMDLVEATGALVLALAGLAVITKISNGVKTLGDGFNALRDSFTSYKARLVEVMAENAAAEGSVTTLGAAFTALGTSAKVALAGTAIGLVVTGLVMLADKLKPAPPDVDKLTDSLERLGDKGTTTGELAKTFSGDLGQLGDAVDRVNGKIDDSVQTYNRFGQAISKSSGFGLSLDDAKGQIGSLDQSLANMVQGGHADLAAAAIKRLDDAMVAQGKDPAELNKELQKYGDALRSLQTQNDLTAASMGPFGQAAQDASGKLQDETNSAQGLHDAIVSVNDAARGSLNAMASFEQSIADAAKAASTNAGQLHMQNGELDLSTQAARDNEKALSDLASNTDAAAEAALKNGESVDHVNDIYAQGRDQLIKYAEEMGLNTDQAKQLADQILATPDKTAQLKGDETDLQQKIADMDKQLASLPPDKQVTLLAEKAQAEKDLAEVQAQIDAMHGTTVTIVTDYTQVGQPGGRGQMSAFAHGGIIGTAATGGPRNGMTLVGEMGPELVRLPSGSTVYPAGQSAAMMQAGAAGPATLQIEWVGGQAGDDFMAWLRKNIRIRGGNVQTVLGQ